METREELYREICTNRGNVSANTLAEVLAVAVELAREGREGKKVGTLFVISDEEAVLRHSKPLILDPLAGHPKEVKHISNRDMRETVKELAMMDGAFVVADDGTVLSACRYIDTISEGVSLPLGLGARHLAAASISKHTNAVAIVVSESSIVRVYDDGEMLAEIIPELWMLKNRQSRIYNSNTATGEVKDMRPSEH